MATIWFDRGKVVDWAGDDHCRHPLGRHNKFKSGTVGEGSKTTWL